MQLLSRKLPKAQLLSQPPLKRASLLDPEPENLRQLNNAFAGC